MERPEFEAEMRKAQEMGRAGIDRQNFWAGYARGLQRGYHGEKFGTAEEHRKWWSMAEAFGDLFRQERGYGYRAGFRCATLGRAYCSQNDFCCETCSRVKHSRDCHNNPCEPGLKREETPPVNGKERYKKLPGGHLWKPIKPRS